MLQCTSYVNVVCRICTVNRGLVTWANRGLEPKRLRMQGELIVHGGGQCCGMQRGHFNILGIYFQELSKKPGREKRYGAVQHVFFALNFDAVCAAVVISAVEIIFVSLS